MTTTLIVNALATTWLFGTSCEPGEAGVFETLLTNQHGCDSLVIETIVFQLSDTTYLQFSSCNPQDTGLVANIFTNQNGCDSIVFATTVLLPTDTTFLSLQSCSPQDVGTVTSIFINQNGCDSIVFQVTTLLPSPAVSMEILSHYHGFNVSCAGAADGVAQVTANGGTSPFSYGWQNGQQTPVASQLGGGTQAVTVTDANGCQVSGSVTLTEPQPLVLSFLIQDLRCTVLTDGSIEVEVTGGAGSYIFALNDGTPQASGFFPIAIEGAYKIEAQDVNGCESSQVVVVGAPEPFTVNLGPDVEIEEGDSVAITATIPEIPIADIASVSWSPLAGLSCQDCLQPTAKPTESTTYTVVVTSESGCTASDDLTVTVKPKDIPAQDGVYIPTAFSPNDDGINDFFVIYSGTDVAEIVFFRIFTRKGDQVFELRNAAPNQPAFGWDGYFRGEKMNPGVFAWTAVVRFADGHTQNLKGDVVLLR